MEVVGIDLGTTNTLVCINQKGKEKCLKFGSMDSELLPSCIYVDSFQDIYVGEEAQEEGILDSENFISSAKTYMGKEWKKECNGLTFTPTDVATEILKMVRKKVIESLGINESESIDAVITVPAYFNSKQRAETRKAGENAGLNVVKIIAEPTAAAVAFIEDMEVENQVFVVDFGGGTFDLSVLKQDENENYVTCHAPGGNNHLGGDDLDQLVFEYLIEWLEEEIGVNLSTFEKSGLKDRSEYLNARATIKREAEKAKIKLSKKTEADIRILNIFSVNGESKHFQVTLTRERFEKCCQSVFDRIDQMIREYIQKENISVSDIEEIVLVGGSCYIPKVKEIVENIFHKKTNTSMDLSTLVAKGACIVANSLDGVETSEFVDVISHSLGVEVQGKKFVKMLKRGTRIGNNEVCVETKEFSTTEDNQDSISVNVYEIIDDENETDVTKLSSYGRFILDGIKKEKKGEALIEIQFEYDADGCLVVTATDKKNPSQSKSVEMYGEIWEQEKNTNAAPIDFMLLLDISGSMNSNDSTYNGNIESRIATAKRACAKLVNEMIDFSVHRMGLGTFESDAQLINSLTADKKLLEEKIAKIDASDGLTALANAIKLGQDELRKSNNEKVMIIVTDGIPCIGDTFNLRTMMFFVENQVGSYEEFCVKAAETAKKDEIRIVIIGVGMEQSGGEELMTEIASQKNEKNDFYSISDMGQLTETFATVIRDIVERGV